MKSLLKRTVWSLGLSPIIWGLTTPAAFADEGPIVEQEVAQAADEVPANEETMTCIARVDFASLGLGLGWQPKRRTVIRCSDGSSVSATLGGFSALTVGLSVPSEVKVKFTGVQRIEDLEGRFKGGNFQISALFVGGMQTSVLKKGGMWARFFGLEGSVLANASIGPRWMKVKLDGEVSRAGPWYSRVDHLLKNLQVVVNARGKLVLQAAPGTWSEQDVREALSGYSDTRPLAHYSAQVEKWGRDRYTASGGRYLSTALLGQGDTDYSSDNLEWAIVERCGAARTEQEMKELCLAPGTNYLVKVEARGLGSLPIRFRYKFELPEGELTPGQVIPTRVSRVVQFY